MTDKNSNISRISLKYKENEVKSEYCPIAQGAGNGAEGGGTEGYGE
jgi:hypothetical protein